MQQHHRRIWNLVYLVAVFVNCGTTSCQQTASKQIRLETTEVSLGKIPDRLVVESVTISPNGSHVAYAAVRDGKFVVMVDGVAGTGFDAYGETSWPSDHYLIYAQTSRAKNIRMRVKTTTL
jgi:hypothetical protein